VYHHAFTQTPTIKKEFKDFSNLRTRETQTFETRTLSVQSYREAGSEFGFLMLLLVVIQSRSSHSLSLYFSLTQTLIHTRRHSHTHKHEHTHTLSLSVFLAYPLSLFSISRRHSNGKNRCYDGQQKRQRNTARYLHYIVRVGGLKED
jgi:hypothetical protein